MSTYLVSERKVPRLSNSTADYIFINLIMICIYVQMYIKHRKIIKEIVILGIASR